jgi:glycosyltransferase involved in cell wall biosynthesis
MSSDSPNRSDAAAPLRVLHAEFSANWGGQEYRVIEQMEWLRRAGHQVGLACRPDSEIMAWAVDRELPVHPLVFRGVYNPLSMWMARALTLRNGFQIVDCHGLRDAVAFSAARHRCAVVRTQHVTGMVKGGWRHRMLWHGACDHVVATAGRIKDELTAARLTDGDRITVIGEWAADEFFRIDDKPRHRAEMRAEFGLSPGRPVIVNVGMLRHDKGQEYLIEAGARLRRAGSDAVILLVGGSTAQAARETVSHETILRRRVEQLGLADRVIFAGYRKDVARLVQAADVQVVASVAVEGQSRTVPQAFAAAVPVVATCTGGLPELVVPDHTGLLVAPRDAAALAEAIGAILRGGSVVDAMVRAARQVAIAQLSIDAKMGQTLALYRRLVAAKRAAN